MSKAWALVDRKERVIKMNFYSKALAIFDTRRAARAAQQDHSDTVVVPVLLKSLSREGAER